MTPENRTLIATSRVTDYHSVMRTTLLVLLGIGAVIEFGPGGYSAPLTALVVATCAYGILAGSTALDDIAALRDDLDEATAATAYGKGIQGRNIAGLKMTSALLIALVGFGELFALFT